MWKNDSQDGYGIEKWADKSRYNGEYKKGLKHGKGDFFLADGSCYKGDWVKDLRDGEGVEID